MRTQLIVVTTALALAAPAFAQSSMEKKPESGKQAGKMDMSKMGPWTRKPTNESQTKKDVMAFFKQEDELMKKGDFEGDRSAGSISPCTCSPTTSRGKTTSMEMNREQYAKEMKPFYEQHAEGHEDDAQAGRHRALRLARRLHRRLHDDGRARRSTPARARACS